MSEGENKEKDSPKIKGCETGNISMTDTLELVKIRGCEITLKVRELTKVEHLWISDEFAKIKKLKQKPATEITILGEKIALTETREVIDRIWEIWQALRLGASEKLFDEGWSGVEGRLLADPSIRKNYKDDEEVPLSVSTFLALGAETRLKLATAISEWFSPITQADVKNLSGE